MNAPQRQHLFVEPGAAMHQLHVQRGADSEAVEKGQRTTEQCIARGLCWQRDVESSMLVGRLQPQVSEKGQLGLTLAHRRLDQQQRRALHTIEQKVGLRLQRTRRQLGALYDPGDQMICRGRRSQQRLKGSPTDLP